MENEHSLNTDLVKYGELSNMICRSGSRKQLALPSDFLPGRRCFVELFGNVLCVISRRVEIGTRVTAWIHR